MADRSPSLDSIAILMGALIDTRRSGDINFKSECAMAWTKGVWSERSNLKPLKSKKTTKPLIKLIDEQNYDREEWYQLIIEFYKWFEWLKL